MVEKPTRGGRKYVPVLYLLVPTKSSPSAISVFLFSVIGNLSFSMKKKTSNYRNNGVGDHTPEEGQISKIRKLKRFEKPKIKLVDSRENTPFSSPWQTQAFDPGTVPQGNPHLHPPHLRRPCPSD